MMKKKKIENRLKAKKFESIDKVARRTHKAQKAFDEAADYKRRKAHERDLPVAERPQDGQGNE